MAKEQKALLEVKDLVKHFPIRPRHYLLETGWSGTSCRWCQFYSE